MALPWARSCRRHLRLAEGEFLLDEAHLSGQVGTAKLGGITPEPTLRLRQPLGHLPARATTLRVSMDYPPQRPLPLIGHPSTACRGAWVLNWPFRLR